MYFRLRRDADDWFKDISGHFTTKFDLYYLCLMCGFAANRRATLAANKATDITDSFPSEFREKGNLLVGILINSELVKSGIDLKERESVNKLIGRLVTPASQSYLTDDGVKAMNEYANAGFDILLEQFNDRPRTIETFVRRYSNIVPKLAP